MFERSLCAHQESGRTPQRQLLSRRLDVRARQRREGRGQWITAASKALNLTEQHEGQLWLEEGELVVGTDKLLTELQALVAYC